MSSMLRGAATAALAVGVGLALQAPVPASAQMGEQVKPEDWPHYHRTLEGGRYSPLSEIDSGNVGELRVAWAHQPGAINHGLQATPVVVDGVVYYSGSYNRVFAIDGVTAGLRPRGRVTVTATGADGAATAFEAVVRIDTPVELEYYRHGGILPYVLRQLAADG